jgi:gas vesicle protein
MYDYRSDKMPLSIKQVGVLCCQTREEHKVGRNIMAKGFRLGSFLLGGLVGAALGLLYAPRPGAESRALIAEKVDEAWGEGQDIYSRGVDRIQAGIADFQPTIDRTNDELRDKINTARTLIADQVVKNAAAAHDVINDKVPAVAETITQAVEVVQGQLDAAAGKLKGGTGGSAEAAADTAKEATKEAAEAVADAADDAVDAAKDAASDVADAAKTAAE